MAKISAVLVLLSLAVSCTNAGVRTDYLSEPSLEIQVLRNSVLSRPKVRIVAPAEGPTYVVSPLRVNIPLGPLVFPAIADVPENAIIKSPPLRLIQKSIPYIESSYGEPTEVAGERLPPYGTH